MKCFVDQNEKQYFANKRITVMGLGIVGGGVETVKFLARNGAKVLVTDLKTEKKLKESLERIKKLPLKLVLGKHRKKDFTDTDLIIKNPGVPANSPFLGIARNHGIPIETDIGIFFKLCKSPVIGITGTKGKSTTATLIYRLLKNKFPKTVLAGNIGTSPLQSLEKISQKTKVVLELSSWQLEGLIRHKKSPQIAVITNIYKDHLNRYKNLKNYIAAKKIIFRFQKPNDILVLNYDDPIVRKLYQLANSRVYFFSREKIPPRSTAACFIKNKKISFGKEKTPICSIEELNIEGEHNISNALAAISVAKLCKISSENIKKNLKNFKGISLRQELIREINGTKYFNDTTATIPEATIAAIKTLKSKFPKGKIVLIAGGEDKNLNYNNLAKEIKKNVECLILLMGSASKKIKRNLHTLNHSKIIIAITDSMQKAVKKSSRVAKKGDIVILSPGAASFNLFKNEFDRGKLFTEAVKKIK